jgi:hypothetical protein
MEFPAPSARLSKLAHQTRALTLLSVGSFAILGGWVLAFGGGGADLLFINFAIALTWLGALLHLVAWAHLAVGLPSRSLVRGIFGLSLLAFTLGIVTLPYAFPTRGWVPAWFAILFAGIFVLVPSIYGPVIALQGTIFMLMSGHLRPDIRWLTAKLAALSLMILGAFALSMQVSNTPFLESPFAAPFLSLGGFAGFAYMALRLAWGGGSRDERQARLRAVSW